MQVEIFSDVVCPWCYIGKQRFEAALADFEHRDQVEVRWRSFELDPTAWPAEAGGDYAQRLATKYGTTRAQAQQMIDSMTAAAAGEGLQFHLERAIHANTFNAHQVIHLAAEHGVQHTVKQRLLSAYFTDGLDIADTETLARLAGEAGLAADEVRAALAEQRYAGDVRADEAEAAALGIGGVPFFVIDRTYGVSGAQPAQHLLAALRHAFTAGHPLSTVPASDEAPACGPDGCPS